METVKGRQPLSLNAGQLQGARLGGGEEEAGTPEDPAAGSGDETWKKWGESTPGAQLVVRRDVVTLAGEATPSEPSAPLAGALTDTGRLKRGKAFGENN